MGVELNWRMAAAAATAVQRGGSSHHRALERRGGTAPQAIEGVWPLDRLRGVGCEFDGMRTRYNEKFGGVRRGAAPHARWYLSFHCTSLGTPKSNFRPQVTCYRLLFSLVGSGFSDFDPIERWRRPR